jgi:hypothetical protein
VYEIFGDGNSKGFIEVNEAKIYVASGEVKS